MEPENYHGPGLYRHFKGELYAVVGVALTEATHEQLVIYTPIARSSDSSRNLYEYAAQFYSRPLDEFNDRVPAEKFGTIGRFERVA